MRAVGLITEYNPFHNGHLHHLRESRRISGCEAAVAVMSGHFLQRGEPALADKWLRAEMALAAGVDVVVELPFPWACNSAPHFALGAVRALEALGGIEALCFGSESGSLEELQTAADLLVDRADTVEAGTAELLRQGVSYPEARARVFADLADGDPGVLATPNNILGIEYLKALRIAGSSLRPHTLPRLGAGYHDPEAVNGIASATGIRRLLAEGEAAPYLPPPVRPLLEGAVAAGRTLAQKRLDRLLLARLLRGAESLREIYQIEGGIENRLFEAALEAGTWEELVAAVKSRQFTRTRIQRLMSYVLLEAGRREMEEALAAGPLYLHLLGCSARGRSFLAAGRKERSLPLVQNFSRIQPILRRRYGEGGKRRRLAEAQMELELRATRTYTLLTKRWDGGNRNRDFFEELRTVPAAGGEGEG